MWPAYLENQLLKVSIVFPFMVVKEQSSPDQPARLKGWKVSLHPKMPRAQSEAQRDSMVTGIAVPRGPIYVSLDPWIVGRCPKPFAKSRMWRYTRME